METPPTALVGSMSTPSRHIKSPYTTGPVPPCWSFLIWFEHCLRRPEVRVPTDVRVR